MARGRRPTELVRHEILEAAGALLLEVGMSGFTMEKVAARSGASKMTVYKLWPSKGALAMAGYFARVEPVLEFPESGDIEADLRTQLAAFVELLTGTSAGTVLGELIGAAQTDPALMAAFLTHYSTPRRTLAVHRMDVAKRAGRLRPDLDCQSVVDQLWGACYHRLLLPEPELDHAFADRLVDNLFRGIGPVRT